MYNLVLVSKTGAIRIWESNCVVPELSIPVPSKTMTHAPRLYFPETQVRICYRLLAMCYRDTYDIDIGVRIYEEVG